MLDIQTQTEQTFNTLKKYCIDFNIKLTPLDEVSENDAALLIGYSSGDALRKQCELHGGKIGYRQLGNRRLYCLYEISSFIIQSRNRRI